MIRLRLFLLRCYKEDFDPTWIAYENYKSRIMGMSMNELESQYEKVTGLKYKKNE